MGAENINRPYRQLPWSPPALVVRSVLAPEMLQPTLRGLVAELDRQVPTADMQTTDGRLAGGVAAPRFLTLLLSTVAAVALMRLRAICCVSRRC
jgi:hypothetical protein